MINRTKEVYNLMIGNEQVLVQLKDDAIMEIEDRTEIDTIGGGCPTCGYDDLYSNTFYFWFKDGSREKIEFQDYNEVSFSYSDFMIFMASNLDNFKEMTRQEFLDCFTSANISRKGY